MKKIALCLALLSFLAVGNQCFAVICPIDQVPAATLLLPYFAVDYTSATEGGQNALFSINTPAATAVLAHVVVWSDLSVPVLDFNVYLTGYDVQTVNLCDIIHSGTCRARLPRAGPERHHQPARRLLAGHQLRELPGPAARGGAAANFIAHIQTLSAPEFPILTAAPADHLGDNIARGYVTVDTSPTAHCVPRRPGYFGPVARRRHQPERPLGRLLPVELGGQFADGNPLVHIEGLGDQPRDHDQRLLHLLRPLHQPGLERRRQPRAPGLELRRPLPQRRRVHRRHGLPSLA